MAKDEKVDVGKIGSPEVHVDAVVVVVLVD